jgi:Spy/CpxP family protein refolding chaperone
MKNFNFFSLIFTVFLLMLSFSSVCGQEPEQSPEQTFEQKKRPNLLAELGLSLEQIRQIRRINRESQPLVRAARLRMKEANLALDQAIYANTLDEAIIQTRLKEAQTAQAEFIKMRSLTEFAVRKVLLPEQLTKFREIRLKFMDDAIESRRNQKRRPALNNSNQKFNNRFRKLPAGN